MGGLMQTLLIVAVVVITLAIIAQAGVLLAMYLLSRRLTGKVEGLMEDSRRLMEPLESITNNLKSVSNDLAQTGEIARAQILHIQELIVETRENIRMQLGEVRERVLDTVDEACETVMRPIRQYSAIAQAIAEGIRTFFRGRREDISTVEERPAA
jgi:virulence-associated protein VagC